MTDFATLTQMVDKGPRQRTERFQLVQISGADAGRVVPLTKESTLLGSSAECDVVVASPGVSRKHCQIDRTGQHFLLRDAGSKNGTYLESLRIKEAYLKPGCALQTGETFFRFEPVYERLGSASLAAAEFGELKGSTPAMAEVFAALSQIAPTDATVLLQGETGTGKGLIARAIHRASKRHTEPCVVFDCGAVTDNLVASALFGHERGAFTGAVDRHIGAIERAGAGTLFIDETGDLPWELQPKLLRVLEEGELTRLGSENPLPVRCRIIAASQHNLWAEVQAGRFRQDLFFRLAVVTIPLPSLRQRRADVPVLFDHFAKTIERPRYPSFAALPPDTQQALLEHAWPGNVRELRNVVQRLHLLGTAFAAPPMQATAQAAPVPPAPGAAFELPFKDAKTQVVEDFERSYLQHVMQRSQGQVALAARLSELDRRHLYTLLQKYQILPKDSR